jgi:hypothetical protein
LRQFIFCRENPENRQKINRLSKLACLAKISRLNFAPFHFFSYLKKTSLLSISPAHFCQTNSRHPEALAEMAYIFLQLTFQHRPEI